MVAQRSRPHNPSLSPLPIRHSGANRRAAADSLAGIAAGYLVMFTPRLSPNIEVPAASGACARIAPARRREALSSRSGAMRRFFFARIEAVPRFLEHANRTEKSDLLSPRRAAPSVSRFKIHRPAPGYLRFRSLNDLFNLRRGLIRKSAFLRRQTEEIFFGHINLSQLNQ